MSFVSARANVAFMNEFKDDVLRLWTIEDQARAQLREERVHLGSVPYRVQQAIQHQASDLPGYSELRSKVARDVLRAIKIALSCRIPITLESYPAPAVGGPVISVNVLHAILMDTSHSGVTRVAITDAIDQTIGTCGLERDKEFRRLFNPFHWARAALVFVIRIPFMLIQASGFDVAKVEDHFLAKMFKVIEIVVIAALLLKIGLDKDQIVASVKDFLR